MASKRATDYWKSGVALNTAWHQFAPLELRLRFEKSPGLLDALVQTPESEIRLNLLGSMANAGNSSLARMQLEREMKEEVLTDLFNGQLIATGYREFPSRSQSPVVIDPAAFENDGPNWENETYEVHGFRYGRIRICDPRTLGPLNSEPKGSRAVIDQAIDLLLKENPYFGRIPRKAACQKIRDYLSVNAIPGNGMSDQNLAKAIVRKCGQKRISAKSN